MGKELRKLLPCVLCCMIKAKRTIANNSYEERILEIEGTDIHKLRTVLSHVTST